MAATDPQRYEAGVQGGHAAPPSPSRRAELRRGRHTNALQNRRDAQQASVGYGLGPTGHGARLDTWTRDPEGIPQVPRRTVRPYTQRQTASRNGVTLPSLSRHRARQRSPGAGVHRIRGQWGMVSEANASGKARGYADGDPAPWMVKAQVAVKRL